MNQPYREPLLDAVHHAWTRWDSPPDGLIETVLVALAMDDLEAEYELLTLVSREGTLAGTRSDVTGDRVLIEFRSEAVTVLLRVSHERGGAHRLDGWVTPASGGAVTLTQGELSQSATIDVNGRFDLTSRTGGLARLIVQPTPDHDDPEHDDPQHDPDRADEFRTTLFEI